MAGEPKNQIQPTIIRSADYRVMFANHVRARIAPTDLGIIFGFTDETDRGIVSEEFIQIVMPWSTAKGIILTFSKVVDLYESANGEISLSGPLPIDKDKAIAAVEEVKDKAKQPRKSLK
jgi:hypothetical protein